MEYHEFCVSELRERLRSECQEFEWSYGEERIEGKDFATEIDVYGENDRHAVLIQFEMHEGAPINALKVAYCLEENHRFKGKRILILHILSPFFTKPESVSDKLEECGIPESVSESERNFRKWYGKKITRESARRGAHKQKLLCQFIERKGYLNSGNTMYKVIDWDLGNFSEVFEATIVLPKEEPFPEQTPAAIENLAKQIRAVIDRWKGR